MTIFPISRPALGGFIDRIEVDESGLIRIVAWHASEFDEANAPRVRLDGKPVALVNQFRYLRSDAGGEDGLVWEYVVPAEMIGERRRLAVNFGWAGEGETQFEEELRFVNPHHRRLLDESEVKHREDIYGPGPPNEWLEPEVWAMAKKLKGPVLDFGCGRGLLVDALRKLGTEAEGLELDSPLTRQYTPKDVTLYDGRFPSPLPEGRFASVVCSEVLEHIPDYEGAVKEIARLAGETAFFTVPDASAIPLGYQHGVVPWHLLEGTHVNFFTQSSLRGLLSPHFHKIQFGRMGLAKFGTTRYWVSLTAWCEK